MLHLKLFQLDLGDPERLQSAKQMMKEMETSFQKSGLIAGIKGRDGIKIEFKGFKTNDYTNPSKSTAMFLEIDESSSSNQEGISKLKTVVHQLIQEAIARNLVSKSDLARSHISFEQSSKTYINKKLNVHIIQTRKNKNFDAKSIIDTYGNKMILGQ